MKVGGLILTRNFCLHSELVIYSSVAIQSVAGPWPPHTWYVFNLFRHFIVLLWTSVST
jgi:hypothetical protein